MVNKFKVPATATLVLQAAREIYTSSLEMQYLAAIDYSAVSALYRDLKAVYPHFDQLITFRKLGVRASVVQHITTNPAQQLIMLGAGLDPLSLYLVEHHNMAVSQIFEVDNGYIEEKRNIYNGLQVPEKVHLLKCDLLNTDQLVQNLREAGYDARQPATIIFEGVIHYITNEDFVQLMQPFASPDKKNWVIMDYVPDEIHIADQSKAAYNELLQIAATYLNGGFNINTREEMLKVVASLGGCMEQVIDLFNVEKKVTGNNTTFREPGEALFELLVFRL